MAYRISGNFDGFVPDRSLIFGTLYPSASYRFGFGQEIQIMSFITNCAVHTLESDRWRLDCVWLLEGSGKPNWLGGNLHVKSWDLTVRRFIGEHIWRHTINIFPQRYMASFDEFVHTSELDKLHRMQYGTYANDWQP